MIHAVRDRSTLLPAMLACALVAGPAASEGRKYETIRADEDWSFLAGEPDGIEDAFDPVKYAEISDTWHLTFGGFFRARFESDKNRTLGASPIERDTVIRSGAALDLEIGHEKNFRWVTEIRAAESLEAERPIPVFFHDDPDVQVFFLEGTFMSETLHPVTIRGGRQELQLGAGRLVAPLDWWNARRTFDGIQVIVNTARTETAIFGLSPVDHEPHDVDTAIEQVVFAGAYSTFKPKPGHALDFYGLVLTDSREIYASEIGAKEDLERDVAGVRYDWFGESGWLAETEWAIEGGNVGEDDLSAWSGSATFGHEWRESKWKTRVSLGLDAASGDDDPTDGDRGTFDPLFPDGHRYFGSMDLVGRSNVKAARIDVTTRPAPGLKWTTTLHRFWLFDDQDALYDMNGKSLRRDPTGASGDEVGTELDMLFSYTFERHHWVGFELCRWWSDDFVEATGLGDDAWFAWLAYEFRF